MAGAPEPSLDDHLWTIAVARLMLPRRGVRAGAAEPRARGVPAPARGRHQRLGRRLARDARPRQSRGALARPRPARGRDRRRRAYARAAASRVSALPARRRSAGSSGPCAAPCSPPPTATGWRATRARGSRARAPSRRPRGRTAAPEVAVGPRRSRAHSSARRGAEPARQTRALLERARPGGRAAGSRRGRAARRAQRRRGHLRGLPEHQLHQRLLLPLRLLCLLQGPSRPRICAGPPTSSAVDEIVRRAPRHGTRRHRGVPAGRHPSRLHRRSWYLELVARDPGRAARPARPRVLAARGLAGRRTAGMPLRDYLARLRDAGLGRLPGTAAEILDDEVRRMLCPDKLRTTQWLEVMRTAHSLGIRTTSTIMFGHIEAPRAPGAPPARAARPAVARPGLHRVRAAAVRAHGGADRPEGPGAPRARRSARRSCCTPPRGCCSTRCIPNIQASWVKLGRTGAAAARRGRATISAARS